MKGIPLVSMLLASLALIAVNTSSTPMPKAEVHGRSFAPQLLGKPGKPRPWVHIQHESNRQVRNRDYMLNNKDELRRVVELWQEPATPNENKEPEKEAAARKTLQAVFDALGNGRTAPSIER